MPCYRDGGRRGAVGKSQVTNNSNLSLPPGRDVGLQYFRVEHTLNSIADGPGLPVLASLTTARYTTSDVLGRAQSPKPGPARPV
jgi:hypothetical protein